MKVGTTVYNMMPWCKTVFVYKAHEHKYSFSSGYHQGKEGYEEGIFNLYSPILLLQEQNTEMVLGFKLEFKYIFILYAWQALITFFSLFFC